MYFKLAFRYRYSLGVVKKGGSTNQHNQNQIKGL